MDKGLLAKTYVHLILIASIGLIVYSNTFDVPFQWDEKDFIENNPIVKDLDYFLNIGKLKENPFTNRYVGFLTFALNYKFHGLDVAGYHVFNITIHLLNAILVYFLVSLTFRTPSLSDSSLKGQSAYIALFTGLLFVSHPIQTEAVTYIFQRLASLAAFFYLLSLVLYIKWRLGREIASPSARNDDHPTPILTKEGINGEIIARSKATKQSKFFALYLLSLLSAVLAMKTKENAFTLPLSIALYDFLFFKPSAFRFRKGGSMVVYRLLILAPFMLLIPLLLPGHDKPLVGAISQTEYALRQYREIPRIDYLYTQFSVIVTYIRLLFLPVNQNVAQLTRY